MFNELLHVSCLLSDHAALKLNLQGSVQLVDCLDSDWTSGPAPVLQHKHWNIQGFSQNLCYRTSYQNN